MGKETHPRKGVMKGRKEKRGREGGEGEKKTAWEKEQM